MSRGVALPDTSDQFVCPANLSPHERRRSEDYMLVRIGVIANQVTVLLHNGRHFGVSLYASSHHEKGGLDAITPKQGEQR